MRRSCTASRPPSSGATVRRHPWGMTSLRSEIILIGQLFKNGAEKVKLAFFLISSMTATGRLSTGSPGGPGGP